MVLSAKVKHNFHLFSFPGTVGNPTGSEAFYGGNYEAFSFPNA
jgi:hypothetical protein